MNDTSIEHSLEKIPALQDHTKALRELISELLDADSCADDMRDVKLARSELNKVLLGFGGAYACLSAIKDREVRRENISAGRFIR